MVRMKSNLRAWHDIASYLVTFLLNVAKISIVFRGACPACSSSPPNFEFDCPQSMGDRILELRQNWKLARQIFVRPGPSAMDSCEAVMLILGVWLPSS